MNAVPFGCVSHLSPSRPQAGGVVVSVEISTMTNEVVATIDDGLADYEALAFCRTYNELMRGARVACVVSRPARPAGEPSMHYHAGLGKFVPVDFGGKAVRS